MPIPNAVGLRFFWFPYAGSGTAAFRGWANGLPEGVQLALVQLPGREARAREQPFVRMDALVGPLTKGLAPYLDRPFVLAGHSMGALLAFEVARRLRAQGGPRPTHIFALGHPAPQVQSPDPPRHLLPEKEFLAELSRLGGTPQAVLEHPELMEFLLPVLRADMELCETYRFTPEPPLACGVSAYGGLGDGDVSRDALDAWSAQTNGPFSVRMFPGAHFFLHTAEREVLGCVADELRGLLSSLP